MISSFDLSAKLSAFLFTAAVLTAAGCNLSFNSSYSFNFTGVEAESAEEGSFSEGIELIEIDNRFGNVDILLAEGEPGWTWESKVWASDQEAADSLLKQLAMDVSTDGSKQTWAIVLPDSSPKLNGIESNLTLNVSADVDVKLLNAHGNVKVENVAADVSLINAHGNLNVSGIASGSVDVRHGNTNLVSASGEVSIQSAHGNVSASNTEGKLVVNASHSSITVDRAGDVELHSSHGNTKASNISGNVIATNSHSSIQIFSSGSSVSARTQHGNIDLVVSNPEFESITADASHGSLNVGVPDIASPSIDMSAPHGDAESALDNNADSPQKVTLKTSHGNIRVFKSGIVTEIAE